MAPTARSLRPWEALQSMPNAGKRKEDTESGTVHDDDAIQLTYDHPNERVWNPQQSPTGGHL